MYYGNQAYEIWYFICLDHPTECARNIQYLGCQKL